MSGQKEYRRGPSGFSSSLKDFWGTNESDDEYVYSDDDDSYGFMDRPLTPRGQSPDSQTMVDLFKDDYFEMDRENSPQQEENPATNGFIPEGWGVGRKPNSPVQQVQETKVNDTMPKMTFNTRTGWGVPSVGSHHTPSTSHISWRNPTNPMNPWQHHRTNYTHHHTPYVPVTIKMTLPKVYIFDDPDDEDLVKLVITKKERIEKRGNDVTTIVEDEGGTFTLSDKEAVAKLKKYSSAFKYVNTGHGMTCELSKWQARWIMEKYDTTPSFWRHIAMSCICHFGAEGWWDYGSDELEKPVSQQGWSTDFLVRSEKIIDEAVRIWNLRYKAVYIMLRNILKSFGVYRADRQFAVINEWLLRKSPPKAGTEGPWEGEFIYRFQKLIDHVVPKELSIEYERDAFINFMVNSREIVVMHEDAEYMDKEEVKPTSYTFLA